MRLTTAGLPDATFGASGFTTNPSATNTAFDAILRGDNVVLSGGNTTHARMTRYLGS